MSKGIDNQLTKQIGESLAVAELGRRKIIATSFAGNVPEIDLLGYANHLTLPFQVKAINGVSWQFDVRKFLKINLILNKQIIKGINKELNRNVICIFIIVGKETAKDTYFIFEQGFLQDYFLSNYKGRKLPHNINSFHSAIWTNDLEAFRNNWKLILTRFKLKKSK